MHCQPLIKEGEQRGAEPLGQSVVSNWRHSAPSRFPLSRLNLQACARIITVHAQKIRNSPATSSR
jgi:hypothetical protein